MVLRKTKGNSKHATNEATLAQTVHTAPYAHSMVQNGVVQKSLFKLVELQPIKAKNATVRAPTCAPNSEFIVFANASTTVIVGFSSTGSSGEPCSSSAGGAQRRGVHRDGGVRTEICSDAVHATSVAQTNQLAFIVVRRPQSQSNLGQFRHSLFSLFSLPSSDRGRESSVRTPCDTGLIVASRSHAPISRSMSAAGRALMGDCVCRRAAIAALAASA